eukprot:TRINITY_DN9912_c0_g1_i1.p1 TRINITY_DN9912_c0_g1~~TRINITY_DN9912_c0_g1_i1.p1  ORF type:complete len:1322 (+),score=178.20 TRINITY_DN9912_c0_g1_i1:277-4242(+)
MGLLRTINVAVFSLLIFATITSAQLISATPYNGSPSPLDRYSSPTDVPVIYLQVTAVGAFAQFTVSHMPVITGHVCPTTYPAPCTVQNAVTSGANIYNFVCKLTLIPVSAFWDLQNGICRIMLNGGMIQAGNIVRPPLVESVSPNSTIIISSSSPTITATITGRDLPHQGEFPYEGSITWEYVGSCAGAAAPSCDLATITGTSLTSLTCSLQLNNIVDGCGVRLVRVQRSLVNATGAAIGSTFYFISAAPTLSSSPSTQYARSNSAQISISGIALPINATEGTIELFSSCRSATPSSVTEAIAEQRLTTTNFVMDAGRTSGSVTIDLTQLVGQLADGCTILARAVRFGSLSNLVQVGVVPFPCSSGYFWDSSAGGVCTQCPPGFVTLVDRNGCGTCPVGTYENNHQCNSCPAGTKGTQIDGTSVCSPCPQGQSSSTSSTSCSPCPTGTYSNTFTQHLCAPCRSGYGSAANSSTCAPCPANQFSDNGVCQPCPVGSVSTAGSSSCIPCVAVDAATGACQPTSCSAGSVPAAGGGCTQCSAGSYAPSGANSCLSCPAGSISAAGSAYCTPCPQEGQYVLNNLCQNCAAGQYLDTDFTCKRCPDGMTSLLGRNNLKTSCFPCASDAYSNAATNGVCTLCAFDEISTGSACQPTRSVVRTMPSCDPSAASSWVTDCTDLIWGNSFCSDRGVCTCASGYRAAPIGTDGRFVCTATTALRASTTPLKKRNDPLAPATFCEATPIDPTGSNFYANVFMSYGNANVDLKIALPYENSDPSNGSYATTTTLRWPQTAPNTPNLCDSDSPSSMSYIVAEGVNTDCESVWTATQWPWDILAGSLTGGGCAAFTKIVNADTVQYKSVLSIEQQYEVTRGRVSTTRTVTVDNSITVTFPLVLEANTADSIIIFSGAPDLNANFVLSRLYYDATAAGTVSGRWKMELVASVAYPYQLESFTKTFALATIQVLEGGASPTMQAKVVQVSGCTADGITGDCSHKIFVEFVEGCAALNFISSQRLFIPAATSSSDFSTTFNYMCSSAANAAEPTQCPLADASTKIPVATSPAATNTLQLSDLKTGDGCPETSLNIPEPIPTLKSFTSDFGRESIAFVQDDVIGFHLLVQADTSDASARATIRNVAIVSVADVTDVLNPISLETSASYLGEFAPATALCPVAPASASDPARSQVCFKIDTGAGPLGATPVAEGQSRNLLLRVTYEVTFDGSNVAKKRVVAFVSASSASKSVRRSTRSQFALSSPSNKGTVNGPQDPTTLPWIIVGGIGAGLLLVSVVLAVWRGRKWYAKRAETKAIAKNDGAELTVQEISSSSKHTEDA